MLNKIHSHQLQGKRTQCRHWASESWLEREVAFSTPWHKKINQWYFKITQKLWKNIPFSTPWHKNQSRIFQNHTKSPGKIFNFQHLDTQKKKSRIFQNHTKSPGKISNLSWYCSKELGTKKASKVGHAALPTHLKWKSSWSFGDS